MKKIQDIDVKNKNVLVRIDADVTIKNGEVENDRRLRASIPTIKHLLYNDAKVTIIGHIGRPKGKVNKDLEMFPVERKLIELIGTHQNWQILENLRFNPGEEKNDPEFAKELATGQDLFVQDAFATCHRAHVSTDAITKILPSYAGLSVQKEIENLEKLLHNIKKPFTIILGGAKIADKLPVIKNLISKAQNFLIGGAIANTFLASRRHYLGRSLIEPDSYREANIIWQTIMDEKDRNMYLPVDLIVSKSLKKPIDIKIVKISEALKLDYLNNYCVTDIGPETIKQYQKIISQSKTIFWNGNMGISEVKEFSNGTIEIAKAIIKSNAYSVIGGGDTVGAIEKVISTELSVISMNTKKTSNTDNQYTDNLFLSTGGGATLEFLAGKELPGLKAIKYYK